MHFFTNIQPIENDLYLPLEVDAEGLPEMPLLLNVGVLARPFEVLAFFLKTLMTNHKHEVNQHYGMHFLIDMKHLANQCSLTKTQHKNAKTYLTGFSR